jgi:hypothetical protein
MIKNSAEWGFILGDALEEYDQVQVLEAMADESEMTSGDLDDWYQHLLDEALAQEEREVWADFWNDKERA